MARQVKKIICIVCPRGCEITVEIEDGEIKSIKGYTCPLGKKYAEKEVVNPERILMSVVKCINGDLPVVSVKTSKPIPLSMMKKASKALSDVSVEAPVKIGDKIIDNLLDLGVEVVATRPCNEERRAE
ncbi:MAG: DUF1667 domain-containing protein [Crenarchaeota archaeon]|nr:DUF1667 domain-containing protein [Thermoproteota archaeon]